MSTETALATTQSQQPPISVVGLLSAAIDRGITAENATVLEKLMEMHERVEDRNAERAFNSAFSALQSELPVIVATSVIPNRGKYERFEDVMRVVQPLLNRHGFAVTFEQEAVDDKRIKVTCHLLHIAGHSRSTPFAVRLGGRADSDTQADCKASTTAKRNALLQALNIVIRQDVFQDEDEAHNEGSPISQAEADTLRDLCDEVKADRKRFLEYAGAETFEAIPSCRLSELMEILNRKRK